MLIDNKDYPIKNPKYYLVVLDSHGEVDELIFTKKLIKEYLNEGITEETSTGVPEDS